MTINEIETTLRTLEARHPELDEALLVTLLTSGGWDEKTIKEAISLFRGTNIKTTTTTTVQTSSFVPLEETHVLPESIDQTHQLLTHNPETTIETVITKEVTPVLPEVLEYKEPQSLIEPIPEPPVIIKKESEIPHNLPLRPFESIPQVWPFSRYKDVFHGEVMPEEKASANVPLPRRVEETTTVKQQVVEHRVVIDHVRIAPAPLSGKDEKLIVLAGTMLLCILLLLGYMYSNGRL